MMVRRQNPPAKLYWTLGLSVGVGIAMVGSALAQSSKPVPFLAHRAIYDLALDADPSRPSVETARGRIVFEFSGSACEGYTQNFRQVVVLQGPELGERLIDSSSRSFEEADGKIMRYSGSLRINDAEPQETDGTAEKSADGIKVTLKKPEAETVQLKGAAMFPTLHYQSLVGAALKGDTSFETQIFDGTGDGKTISDSFAIIGKALPEAKASDALHKAGFANMKRWPVTISYFDGEGQDRETPSYSTSMELLENGVADALTLNYGDFVLKGTLRQIEVLPQKSCP
jgi:hypothetical protein